MPNLRDIKRRITSVEKTQQITSAMRMVAAAKLRRAQEAMEAARPYAQRMRNTLAEVASAQVDAVHPLLEKREEVKCLELVVVTSDRGLAGAFNANVVKRASAWLALDTNGPLEAVGDAFDDGQSDTVPWAGSTCSAAAKESPAVSCSGDSAGSGASAGSSS